ncbi:MAG: four helix bundle protein [Dokdonella sp.]
MSSSFRELEVWILAMTLVEDIYILSRDFPPDERFGLTAQVRRAAVSVPSCIAEGHARPTTRDYLRFIGIASGSLAEVETQVLVAEKLKLTTADSAQRILDITEHIGRMLNRLRSVLEAKIN